MVFMTEIKTEKVDSTKKFIEKSKLVHNHKYTYDKSEYVKSQNKLIVTCKIHGDWCITPNNHLRGKGCPSCAIKSNIASRSSNSDDFIRKAKATHGEYYSYELVEYTKAKEKVIITCKIHGDFLITPNTHIRGTGCCKCSIITRGNKLRKGLVDFISQAKAIHGDKYCYEKVNYINTKTKVILTCKIHGDFEMTPKCHLRSQGCRECSFLTQGYSRTDFTKRCIKNNGGFGVFYIIECYEHKEVFYKIGISSTDVDKRYSGKSKMPYQYNIVGDIKLYPKIVYDLENHILKELVGYRYEPSKSFKGKTECFSELQPILKCLAKYLNDEGES